MQIESKNDSVEIEGGPTTKLSGFGLEGEYQLVNIHMHWGSDNSKGSEHRVNGSAYPLDVFASLCFIQI